MNYKKFKPPQHLEPYIECFYIWEVDTKSGFSVESPPSAFGSMVFNYGDTYNVRKNCGSEIKVPKSFLTGQATHSYQLNIEGKVGMVGIVFLPAAMNSLFNLPVAELTNERICMEKLMTLKLNGITQIFKGN